jgi:hypothetical protein
MFWGFVLLLIGVWFLARDMGWISSRVSFWTVVLIILGLWMLLKRRRKC